MVAIQNCRRQISGKRLSLQKVHKGRNVFSSYDKCTDELNLLCVKIMNKVPSTSMAPVVYNVYDTSYYWLNLMKKK